MWDLMYTDFWDKGTALELGVLLVPIGQHILLDPQKIEHFLQAHNAVLWMWRADCHSLHPEHIISRNNQQTSMMSSAEILDWKFHGRLF